MVWAHSRIRQRGLDWVSDILTLTWTDTRLWEKLSQRQEEVRLPNCSSKFGVKVVARLKRVVAKERRVRGWIMI